MSGFLSERALPHLVEKLSDARNIKTNNDTLDKEIKKLVDKCDKTLEGSYLEEKANLFSHKTSSSIDCFTKKEIVLGNSIKSKNVLRLNEVAFQKNNGKGRFVDITNLVDLKCGYVYYFSYARRASEAPLKLNIVYEDGSNSYWGKGVVSIFDSKGEVKQVLMYIDISDYSSGNYFSYNNIQLEESDKQGIYLPPDFLKSCGEEENNTIKIVSTGKNLFDYTHYANKHNKIIGIENGLRIDNAWVFHGGKINFKLKPNTKYTTSHKFKMIKEAEGGGYDSTAGRIYLYNDKKNDYFYISGNGRGITSTVTTPSDIQDYDEIIFYSAAWSPTHYGTVELTNIQIEEGETQTFYEPYHSDVKEIKLPHPLRKVGDVADKIYERDGKLFLEQNIGEIVLNGSENWKGYGNEVDNSHGYYYEVSNIVFSRNKALNILSNNFDTSVKWNFPGSVLRGGNLMGLDGSKEQMWIKLSIDKKRLGGDASIANFKEWLSRNNTTVLYPLERPVTRELKSVSLDISSDSTIRIEGNISPRVQYCIQLNKSAQINKVVESIGHLRKRIDKLEKHYDNHLLENQYKIDLLKLEEGDEL